MNPKKSDELLDYGLKLGVPRESTLRLREAFKENCSLAKILREIQRDGMSNHHARILLISAFDLSIGDIQILHLWWNDFISDEELDLDLQEKISKQKNHV